MAARIRSYRNGITPIDEQSRNDLVSGDVVLLTSLDAATTYSWVIAFAPEGSTATFSGSPSAISPGSFTVDLEGAYLIKLTVDAGLGTENTQYVRLRAETAFGKLKLVAAGERRDATGIIPVDIDVEGWANEQNFNLQTLKGFIKPIVSSGRILYVDANDGTENYGDYTTIQAAITAATTAGTSQANQWIILVRPGSYTEDIAFVSWVHVVGWPGSITTDTDTNLVVINGNHTIATTGTESVTLANLQFNNTTVTTAALLTKTGTGNLNLEKVRVTQSGAGATQGAAIDIQGGSLTGQGCTLTHNGGGSIDRVAVLQSGSSTQMTWEQSSFVAPYNVDINPGLVAGTITATFRNSLLLSSGDLALRGTPTTLTIEECTLDGTDPEPLQIHPSGGVYAGNLDIILRRTTILGNISYDVTGIVGNTTLQLGSVEYGSLVFPGGAITSEIALTQAQSIAFSPSGGVWAGTAPANTQEAVTRIAALVSSVHGLIP